MTDHIFTIGHSNQTLEEFLVLLERHGVAVLVDIRSHPYSKYATQFNTPNLKSALPEHGIKYLFMGRELGGQPAGNEYYDDEGHVLYWKIAQSAVFLGGIERLQNGARQYRVAIMCSEEDPKECHRHLLVSRVLKERGVGIDHIRGDGRLETEDEVDASDQMALPLFAEPDERAWRSIRPARKNDPSPDSRDD